MKWSAHWGVNRINESKYWFLYDQLSSLSIFAAGEKKIISTEDPSDRVTKLKWLKYQSLVQLTISGNVIILQKLITWSAVRKDSSKCWIFHLSKNSEIKTRSIRFLLCVMQSWKKTNRSLKNKLNPIYNFFSTSNKVEIKCLFIGQTCFSLFWLARKDVFSFFVWLEKKYCFWFVRKDEIQIKFLILHFYRINFRNSSKHQIVQYPHPTYKVWHELLDF